MRANKYVRGLKAAIENEEAGNSVADAIVDPATPVEDKLVVDDNAESLETDLIEVEQETAEVEADESEVEETVETVEALEAICVSLEAAAANGGLDRFSAQAINVAVGGMYKSVGIRSTGMPSMEAYSGASGRAGSTQLAIETIKEKIQSIWKAIMAAIKRAIEYVVGMFNKIFGAAEKLKARAVKLQETAKKVDGKAKADTFENERLAKALSIDGKTDSVLAGAKELAVQTKTNMSDTTTRVQSVQAMLDDIKSSLDKPEEYLTKAKIPAKGLFNVGSKATSTDGFTDAAAGLSLFVSKEMLGGKAIVVYQPEEELTGEAALSALGDISAVVAAAKGSKTVAPTKFDVPTLTGPDAAEVAKQVESIADDLLAYKKGLVAATELKKAITSVANDASKKKDAEGDAAKGISAMQKTITKLTKLVDQPNVSLSVYALNTGKSLLDAVELSIKQYK